MAETRVNDPKVASPLDSRRWPPESLAATHGPATPFEAFPSRATLSWLSISSKPTLRFFGLCKERQRGEATFERLRADVDSKTACWALDMDRLRALGPRLLLTPHRLP